jgi:thiol:disulfide interchange protein
MRTLLLSLFFTLSLFAAPLKWSLNFDSAFERATAEHKPLLLYITQAGCGTCKYMEENVFIEKKIREYMDAHYVYAKLYLGDKGIPANLEPFATPTFYILNHDRSEVTDAVIGGKRPDAFLMFLEEGVDYYQIKNR